MWRGGAAREVERRAGTMKLVNGFVWKKPQKSGGAWGALYKMYEKSRRYLDGPSVCG